MLLVFPHLMPLMEGRTEVQNLCPSVWHSLKLLLVLQFTKLLVIVNAASNSLKILRFEVVWEMIKLSIVDTPAEHYFFF